MSDEFKEHPGKDQLTAFGLGTLDPSEAEKIAEHLDSCPVCGETILNLQDDTFVSLVRNSPAPAENAAAVNLQLAQQVTIDVASVATDSESGTTELPSELRDHARYEILNLIGRGGMGEVYKALHKVMNRIVAVKVIKPQLVQNDAAVQRFHREVQAAAKLNHPNIVSAYDAEQAGDLHFLVMEHVEGMDLSELVRRSGPLPIADACDLIRQAALGLEHAHQHALVHRDIKPSNLMLTTDGTVKILDLGLALLEEPQGAGVNELTTAGQTMGTLDYMAPEQGGDSHDVDIRTDIYALGATLYKLLTGEPIYAGAKYSTPIQRLTALALTPAPPIQGRREGVSDELAAVIHKMIAKDRNERYATPGEVSEALAPFADQANVAGLLAKVDADTAFLNGPIPSGGASSVQSPQCPARTKPQSRSYRNHIVSLAIGSGALLVLLAAIVFFVQTKDGTIRVEINDPDIEVAIKGTEIVLKQADQGRDIKLSPGDHTLVIQRDGFQFETDKLIIKRGGEVTVRVELLAGEVQVRQGEKLIGQRRLPMLTDDGHKPLTVPTATLPNGWVIGEPVNLGPAVNSSVADDMPCLSADGLTLLFSSNRKTHGGNSDLWTCARPGVDQPWGEAVILGPEINSDCDDYGPCLSADGLTLLFQSDRLGGEGGSDLWMCMRPGVDQPWGKAVNLGPAINSLHNEGGPCLSTDGRVLIFSSNRPGGQGESDLWIARRDDPNEDFSEPVNLGPTVNSSRNELGPCLSEDRLTLFYCSERPGGEGWGDLWMATRADTEEPFSEPVNLGPTVNSRRSDRAPFLTQNGQTLFFSADSKDRPGGQGLLDLYYAPISAAVQPADRPPMAVAPFDALQAKAHQQAWADYLSLPVEKEVELPGNRKLTMVLIPPGEFQMGSTREEVVRFIEQRTTWGYAEKIYNHIPYEYPRHLVRITRPFYLGKYEVTQDQWLGIMGRNPSGFKSSPNHPVEQVSWDDVQPFLVKLNEAASASGMQFALPTEAQWEYACRAGTTTYWHCGDNEDALREYDWFEDNAEATPGEFIPTHPVGRLNPNPFGLYDIHGNVSEWCADWMSAAETNYYAKSPVEDPTGPSSGHERILRGGNVTSRTPAWRCRSAWRAWTETDRRYPDLGFRLAGVLQDN